MTAAGSPYLDDAPSVPPSFDFDLIGETLADVLTQTMDGATVIGLHGPWGSGKTTLMFAIGEALQRRADGLEPVIVDFNAWKYQERDALWRALILRLVGELRARSASQDKLDDLEASLYRAFESQESGPWSINWRTAATEVATVALEALQLGVAGRILQRVFGRRARKDGEPILGEDDVERIGGVLERKTVSRHVERIQSIEQFLGTFKQLVDELRESGRQVVVLVDDLDRCLPDSALEIFEAIKLFLDAPGCGFVVAVDREVIRRGLAIRYGSSRDQGLARMVADPAEYIEKTIAVSYDVPRLSTADVDSLIANAGLSLDLGAENRALVGMGLGHNPRRVKRFLNLLKVQTELAKRAHARDRTVPAPLLSGDDQTIVGVLLKTMLLGYRYPFLLSAHSDPKLLLELQRMATSYRREATTKAGAHRGAKTRRDDKLAFAPAGIEVIKDNEEFWALLAAGPDLISHESDVTALLNWFRSIGIEKSSA